MAFDAEAAEEASGSMPGVPLSLGAVHGVSSFAASVWHGSILLTDSFFPFSLLLSVADGKLLRIRPKGHVLLMFTSNKL